ncbi:MAG TPA: hypothetical protein VMP03_15305 [Methylomirabilota bacterium]|nr:hypothetical protein [Methylomirabilota bacterium]
MGEGRGDQNGEGRGEGNVRRLSDAVRRVRIAEAERSDAFDDLHEAERARLSMLSDELDGVFAEIPAEDDYFICKVAGGSPPRLWIDPTSQVMIGRDRRTYRFLKDTRLGRVVIAETADVARIADTVTDYIAERVIERERTLESDALMAKVRDAATPRMREGAAFPKSRLSEDDRENGGGAIVWLLIALLLGIALGAIGLIGYAWITVPG